MKKNLKVSGQSSKIGIVLEKEQTASEMKDEHKCDLQLVHITVNHSADQTDSDERRGLPSKARSVMQQSRFSDAYVTKGTNQLVCLFLLVYKSV